jgi:hypothetical protein
VKPTWRRAVIHPSRVNKLFGILLYSSFLTFLVVQPGNISSQELDQRLKFRIEAMRWPEAEKLFRTDPRWLGGDGASSVDLQWGRVLWLFGDSFISKSNSRSRRDAVLVRNSLAIQKGYNPIMAKMRFAWKTKNGVPSSFFRQEGNKWFWPASGIMIKDRLLIFLMKIKKAKNDLGFEPCGWQAVLVEDPDKEPAEWAVRYLESPQEKDVIIGSGSAIVRDGYVHVYCTNWRDNKVYLARWPYRSVLKGDLAKPQWWAGVSAGWVGHSVSGPRPMSVLSGGQTEFSVEYVPRLKRFVQIQTLNLLNPCLAVCTTSVLQGPWSGRECFYSPKERNMKDLFIYAGKSHPAVQGADMVFTYVVNTRLKDKLMNDMSVYYPVVLKGWVIVDLKDSSGTAMAMQ